MTSKNGHRQPFEFNFFPITSHHFVDTFKRIWQWRSLILCTKFKGPRQLLWHRFGLLLYLKLYKIQEIGTCNILGLSVTSCETAINIISPLFYCCTPQFHHRTAFSIFKLQLLYTVCPPFEPGAFKFSAFRFGVVICALFSQHLQPMQIANEQTHIIFERKPF